MKTNQTAVQVTAPVETLQLFPAKKTKSVQGTKPLQSFHRSGEFTSEMSIKMLQLFIETITDKLKGKNQVTIYAEKNEGQFQIIKANGMQISVIFQEGGLV